MAPSESEPDTESFALETEPIADSDIEAAQRLEIDAGSETGDGVAHIPAGPRGPSGQDAAPAAERVGPRAADRVAPRAADRTAPPVAVSDPPRTRPGRTRLDSPGPRAAGRVAPSPATPGRDATRPGGPAHVGASPRPVDQGGEHGATAPQLRRFIKSRAYVPMHELRRRFVINGNDDDVTALEVENQVVYVGLPEREGRLLGELVRGGDIGVELSLDPIAPIVVGVYPIRPVPRT